MDIEQLKNELRTLGFTEDQLNQLMDLAAQEAIDKALEDLEANVDDATMEELAQLMEAQPATLEDAQSKIKTVFEKAYGMNAESKKTELIGNYLKQTIEETKTAKDVLNRYQAGDPTAIAQVKAQEGNPDVQKVADMMQ